MGKNAAGTSQSTSREMSTAFVLATVQWEQQQSLSAKRIFPQKAFEPRQEELIRKISKQMQHNFDLMAADSRGIKEQKTAGIENLWDLVGRAC